MKMLTMLSKEEISAIGGMYKGMSDTDRTLMVKFGGDMYFNGQIHGIAMGAGGVLAGCILGAVSGKVIDIIHQRRKTKKLIKELEK